jgi:hypothetical protein
VKRDELFGEFVVLHHHALDMPHDHVAHRFVVLLVDELELVACHMGMEWNEPAAFSGRYGQSGSGTGIDVPELAFIIKVV